jgi:broad specificity phosphatase PhoE
MKTYFARHGETDYNLRHRVQGWLDIELNSTGQKQAEDAAKEFSNSIDIIISSDLARAHQSALPFVDKYPDIPFLRDWRIRERRFGIAEGKLASEFDWDVFWKTHDDVTIEGAEPTQSFHTRAHSFIADLKSMFQDKSCLIITHGGMLNLIQTIHDPNFQIKRHSNLEIVELDW